MRSRLGFLQLGVQALHVAPADLRERPVTEERRQQIVKHAKKLAEDTRVACRNIRHDVINDLKKKSKDKDAHVSEDQVKKIQDEIQKVTDNHIKKLDELLAHKEKEIMTI